MGKMKLKIGGYTLVEMVVTAALVGVLSVGIVSVFISTVQGGKTARAQANVKTQGDYAIVSMERTIRNAIKLPICEPDRITFQYLGDDGLMVEQEYRYLDKSIGVYKNGVFQGDLIKAGQQANSIEVQTVSFICNEGDSYSPGYIAISFVLHTVGDVRQQTTQQFQTTISMRNIP